MTEFRLSTPVSEIEVRRLKAGDIVYLSGKMFTARDAAHERMLEYYRAGKRLPIDIGRMAMFHCGPIVRASNGGYEVVAAGPTTSARMELFEDVVIEKSGVRMIIGKGGMGTRTATALNRFGAVYCAFTGGVGALAAKAVKSVEGVEWLDLGMPEALWVFAVEEFGPLIVAMDSHGNNLYSRVMMQVESKRNSVYEKIS